MRKLFLLLTIIFNLFTSYGQDYHKIDSLKNILGSAPVLNGTDSDTSRMIISLQIAEMYEKHMNDSSERWYNSFIDTNIQIDNISKYQKRSKILAKSLRYYGYLEKKKGDYLFASVLYNYSLQIYEVLKDKAAISLVLNQLGNIEENMGNYCNATMYYERSLNIKQEIGDKLGVSYCLNNLGNIMRFQANYSKAIIYYKRSLEIKEQLGDKSGISYCLTNIAAAELGMGNYSSALLFYNQSLDIFKEIGDKDGTSKCLMGIGTVESRRGDYSTALLLFNQALKIKEEINDSQGISYCLNNMGIINSNMGNYPEAINCYERSLSILYKIGDKQGITSCLMNIGSVLWNQGNYSDAISQFNTSLKISEETGDKHDISSCLNSLGVVIGDQGNHSESISYFEKSLKIKEEIGDKSGISACLNNLGAASEHQGDYTSSILYHKRSLKISEEITDKNSISLSLYNIGIVEMNQNNFPEAISYIENSLKIKEEIKNMEHIAGNYAMLAKAYFLSNLPDYALPVFHKSVEITIKLLKENFSVLSEKEKELFLYQTKSVFNDILSFNINASNQSDSLPGTCFNNELILKGLLLKSTAGIMDVVYNSPDTTLQNTYWLMKQYRNQISSLQGTEEANRDSLIADLEKKSNEQERKLVKLSSEFADIQKLFEYKWEDVQKNLKSGEAAIEFVSFTQGIKNDTTVYAALLITPEIKQPQSIKLFEENQLQAIVGANSETGFGFINSLYGTNKDINESLYRIIWKPLEQYLAGINTIYYAPVGVLNKVSFAALGNENGQFLTDKYNLHQLSTTGKLISQNEKSEIKMNAALFGGMDYNSDSTKIDPVCYHGWKYLPGTLIEKESIEKQFKKNKVDCITYSGKEAKEENFKALFDSTDAPSILHVSTHGFFYPDPEVTRKESESESGNTGKGINFRGSNGFGLWMFVQNKNPMMRSGLVFAGANKVWSEDWGRTDNEGVLTAYEVSNLNMRNTDLVVLSACETGLGDIKGSEGVYGLQRAFKMAGVKYIIMSLWQVPDKETVEFMEAFYKKLLKTKDVRLSFNETQKEMRNKYDPYFWGAFVLIE